MTNNTPPPPADSTTTRAAWLRVLARATAQELQQVAGPVLADYHFDPLRAPEQGLVMVRARIGNQGNRFNLGEATITRCAVRHKAADGQFYAGMGHVLGRDAQRAEQVAQADALLQVPALGGMLQARVIHPLAALARARYESEAQRTEASRVRFFTLQPESP